MDQIERRCLDILGCSGCVVKGCSPELAFDIDTFEEYKYAARCAQMARELSS